MASPAFIYAFDSMDPQKFTEFCGVLFGSRYKGFLLGGVGADGGIDAQLDKRLEIQNTGFWLPEAVSGLLNELVTPEQRVVFQFKHMVAARLGQARTRTQLLNLYTCTPGKPRTKTCELHSKLIQEKPPAVYVLVTNVEVNSQFRNTFIEQCQQHFPAIEHYQVIGLDEIENWLSADPQLGHLYFPTIFGPPRFQLKMRFSIGSFRHHAYASGSATMGIQVSGGGVEPIINVEILNIGMLPSYINSIRLSYIISHNTILSENLLSNHILLTQSKSDLEEPLQVGRKRTYGLRLYNLGMILAASNEVGFPVEFLVEDEIGNVYAQMPSEEVKEELTKIATKILSNKTNKR